jgi:hypothetical protein
MGGYGRIDPDIKISSKRNVRTWTAWDPVAGFCDSIKDAEPLNWMSDY